MPPKKAFTLPSNVEAERTILGSMLLDVEAVAIGTASLTEDSFSDVDPRNKLVFRAINAIWARKGAVDVQTVNDELVNMKLDKDVKSPEYLRVLVDSVVSLDNMDFYVKAVKDQASLRNLLLTMDQIKSDYANGPITDISEFIADASNKIASVASSRQVGDFKTSGEIATAVYGKIKAAKSAATSNVTGITTGFSKINALTHGWQKEDLIIVAARPSMGKTALAMDFALKAAEKNPDKTVALFSLEMSSTLIMQRMLANVAMVENDHIQTGYLTNEEHAKLVSAVETMKKMNLYIDDTANSKLGDILAKATKLKAQKDDLCLIVIDYLGRITAGDSNSKNQYESRQREVGIISGTLKTLARQLHVPIIVVCQLNRDVEKSENKRPQISNLRDSGDVEQDADLVLLLYRGDYYSSLGKKNKKGDQPQAQPGSLDDQDRKEIEKETKKDGDPSIMEVIIAKNRNGKTGTANLLFQKAYSKFSDTTEDFDRSYANAQRAEGIDVE